ncbi:MAG: hypothetical protein Q7S85_04945 [Rugosibacter sp.]|nr:hypothetical protein [Rugosibacter sp.]
MQGPLLGRRVALVILGYGILLTLPAGWSGFVIGHDTFSHLIMSRHFVDQLWAGDFYPRWLPEANAGLGSPVFQFYGPVPYYITALFRPLLSHDPEGWHQLGLAAALAVIASGFTAHAWLRQLAGERAALVGAVLYMSAPYHLAVDLYQRFAFAELWGFVWMPLVMLCARASMRGGRGAVAGLSLSYALLIMTHLPTTLLFSWVPLAYALWLARPDERRGAFIRVAGGMLLGIGLAAIYLAPAMATRQFVRFDIMESGHFHFAHHFLFYAPGRDDGVRDFMYSLGVTVGAMVLVAAGVWSLGRKIWSGNVRREAGFWLGIACLAFFMMIYPSKPVWEAVAILQAVQFPWRLAAILTLAMTLLVTLWIDVALPKRFLAHPASALILGMLLLYQAIPTLKEYAQVGMWSMTPRLAGLTAVINKMEANAGAEGGAGYGQAAVFLGAARLSRYNSFLPTWSNPELFADTAESVRALEKLASRPDKAWPVAGKGRVLVTHWQPPRIELLADAQTPMKIEVLQLYYPGWVARLEGVAARPEVAPSRPDGLLELQIPAGKHRVVIERESLDQERAGRMISILSMLVLSGYLFWPRLRRSANHDHES